MTFAEVRIKAGSASLKILVISPIARNVVRGMYGVVRGNIKQHVNANTRRAIMLRTKLTNEANRSGR